jgi:hypothetical protein
MKESICVIQGVVGTAIHVSCEGRKWFEPNQVIQDRTDMSVVGTIEKIGKHRVRFYRDRLILSQCVRTVTKIRPSKQIEGSHGLGQVAKTRAARQI